MRGIRQRGTDDGIDDLRLDRFKIKTPNVIVEGSSATGDTSQADQP